MKFEAEKEIIKFIESERSYFDGLNTGIDWTESEWDASNWLFHRGSSHLLSFKELLPGKKINAPLPPFFSAFCKAIAVFLQRTKNAGFMSINKYVIDCRRLYTLQKERKESSVAMLTRWHFERAVEVLRETNYKNIYDAANNLQVIASIIDSKRLTPALLEFKHSIGISTSRHSYTPISKMSSDEERKDDEKLPSYESLKAYAICTNHPISNEEEILLRTIDLLIAMGQRGNEITMIPFDCWVETVAMAKSGEEITDAKGVPVIDIGIRYYAEKKSDSKVHWLAKQDIPFARRAVERLKSLTKATRLTAKWQEENPGRLWKIEPETIISDDVILKHISFASHQGLHLFLNRNGIEPVKREYDKDRINDSGAERYYNLNSYRAGDIENVIRKKFWATPIQLKLKKNNSWQTVLTTSQLLSIAPVGSFQLKRRKGFKIKILAQRLNIQDINQALGSDPTMESIFDRRGLKELDGSRIVLTSHQPRHWRNTLYELAGMTNVQQALAMGRQRLDQNATYQHTSLLERTTLHRDFLSFTNPHEKIQFLHNGIREKKILGEVTNLYHRLKEEKGKQLADTFLSTHAGAIHLTPFGGCTHDFSQTPCPKHLQCWNGCSHLHRTNTPGESERIQEQIELGTIALNEMKENSAGEYGADVWINDLQKKVENMQKALDIKPLGKPMKVFPNGIEMTKAIEQTKRSSVSND